MITISGQRVFPGEGNSPTLFDVGWGMARTPRFSGMTKQWYSVLPHAYSVATLVPEEHRIDALLHDAAESVVGDQVATWKNELTKESENEILELLSAHVGYPIRGTQIKEVLDADMACRAAEAQLLGYSRPDSPHLEDIRTSLPDLYAKALIVTAANMRAYTAIECIYDTDIVATEFENTVLNTINNQKVTA